MGYVDSGGGVLIFWEEAVGDYIFGSELLRDVLELGSCAKRRSRVDLFFPCDQAGLEEGYQWGGQKEESAQVYQLIFTVSTLDLIYLIL